MNSLGDNDDGERCYNGDDDGSRSERCPIGMLFSLCIFYLIKMFERYNIQ